MSQLNPEDIINILKEFTIEKGLNLDVILVGGIALYYYGLKDRATVDFDAEVQGEIDILSKFLKDKKIPSDIGSDMSRWSIVAMPPGYRNRAKTIYEDVRLKLKVLHPVDFIIAKLRRFMEQDLEDALFVVRKFGIRPEEIESAAEAAIEASPKDTALFIFQKNLRIFMKRM